jgi:hypothetical protein
VRNAKDIMSGQYMTQWELDQSVKVCMHAHKIKVCSTKAVWDATGEQVVMEIPTGASQSV